MAFEGPRALQMRSQAQVPKQEPFPSAPSPARLQAPGNWCTSRGHAAPSRHLAMTAWAAHRAQPNARPPPIGLSGRDWDDHHRGAHESCRACHLRPAPTAARSFPTFRQEVGASGLNVGEGFGAAPVKDALDLAGPQDGRQYSWVALPADWGSMPHLDTRYQARTPCLAAVRTRATRDPRAG